MPNCNNTVVNLTIAKEDLRCLARRAAAGKKVTKEEILAAQRGVAVAKEVLSEHLSWCSNCQEK